MQTLCILGTGETLPGSSRPLREEALPVHGDGVVVEVLHGVQEEEKQAWALETAMEARREGAALGQQSSSPKLPREGVREASGLARR